MHSTCVKLDCIREIYGRNDENCLDRIDIIGYKTVQKLRLGKDDQRMLSKEMQEK